jgi:hypothetical protein
LLKQVDEDGGEMGLQHVGSIRGIKDNQAYVPFNRFHLHEYAGQKHIPNRRKGLFLPSIRLDTAPDMWGASDARKPQGAAQEHSLSALN